MKRYQQEKKITERNHREHLRTAHGWPKKPVDCPCDLQAGRFRKKDAYDCGRTMCRVCHYEKWLNNGHAETLQEKKAKQKMRDGLKELGSRLLGVRHD
jgi:hypothetical protein